MLPEFASSPTRLVRFFRKSRDSWKARSHKYQERLRQLDGKVRDLQRSRDKWKADAKRYGDELAKLQRQAKERLTQTSDFQPASPASNVDAVHRNLPAPANRDLVPTEADAAPAAPPFCPSAAIASR